MKKNVEKYVDILIERYEKLVLIKDEIIKGFETLKDAYENGGKILIAGNGGSASDSEHIAGELMKSFQKRRTIPKGFVEKLKTIDRERGEIMSRSLEGTLCAIPLVAHEALLTAYLNDVGSEGLFAQQLYGLGSSKDVFLALTTSGNSENIVNAAIVAKAMEMKVVCLTGRDGGIIKNYSDVNVIVPENETYIIQEMHLPIYHCWCHMLEEYFF